MKKTRSALTISLVAVCLMACSAKPSPESSNGLDSGEEKSQSIASSGQSAIESTAISSDDSSIPTSSIVSDASSTSEETSSYVPHKTIYQCNSTEINDKYLAQGYSSVYEDINFKDGFRVSKTFYGAGESPWYSKYIRFYPSLNTPKWTIAQWSSQYDILGDASNPKNGYDTTRENDNLTNTITGKGVTDEDGFLPSKVVKINSETGEIYLEANTSIEYAQPRVSGDPWVHLLLSNEWNTPRKIDQYTSIMMEANFKVTKCQNFTGGAYNVNTHAAQLVWYITIQNRNQSSLGYGKYIWFGIGLWDNRSIQQRINMYRAHDAGTDTLIYNPSSTEYYKDYNGYQPGVGQECHCEVDVYPIISQAFAYAQANGYLSDTTWEDLYIGGTNFGYEIPGTFDIATDIHSLGVYVK